jgi:putative thioredoxin
MVRYATALSAGTVRGFPHRVGGAPRYRAHMDATTSSFDDVVIERSHDVPVLVDFWASWCGPCLALTPVLEQAVAERDGLVELVRVDVDANQELAQRYGVSGIPAVKAFRDGRVADEFVGALSPTAVSTFLDGLLAPPRSDALLEELRASGALPDVVAAVERGDAETALSLVVDAVVAADGDERDALRDLAVALFERFGQDDPVVTQHRRRLAASLY